LQRILGGISELDIWVTFSILQKLSDNSIFQQDGVLHQVDWLMESRGHWKDTFPQCSTIGSKHWPSLWHHGLKSAAVTSLWGYVKNLSFRELRGPREVLWLPFQPPKVTCDKRSGMNWIWLLACRTDACPVQWGAHLSVCTVAVMTLIVPHKLILVHVHIESSYWVIHFESIPLFFTCLVYTDIG
jgi:hypothetical protein